MDRTEYAEKRRKERELRNDMTVHKLGDYFETIAVLAVCDALNALGEARTAGDMQALEAAEAKRARKRARR